MNEKILNLDQIRLDENGVEGFVWPVAIKENSLMQETMARNMVQVGKKAMEREDCLAGAFSVVMHFFMMEAITIFDSYLLVRRLQEEEIRVIPPAYSKVLSSVVKNEAPEVPNLHLAKVLREGPQPLSRLRAPVRFVRDLIVSNGIVRRRIVGPDFQRDIISVNAQSMAEAHARAIGEKITFRRMNIWFGPVLDYKGASTSLREKLSPLLEEALDAVSKGFHSGGVGFPDFIESHLRKWLADALSLSHFHLNHLLKNPSRVPKRLWTGTGGFLWARILRRAVRELGGHITGHDHSLGEGQYRNEVDKNYVEYENCDVFVTSSSRQAECLRSSCMPDLLIQTKPPEILSLPENAERNDFSATGPKKLFVRRRKSAISKNKLQVMYVATFYPGENARYGGCLIPDFVAVDWQARLFGWLIQNNFEVIHKPHPGSIERLPHEFEQYLRIKPTLQRFEKIMNSTDILLFDCHTSTTLAEGILSDQPIVYVNFGLGDFEPDARKMMERRCRFVDGWFDDKNRAQVNWVDLKNAFREAPDLVGDTSFAEGYLGISIG